MSLYDDALPKLGRAVTAPATAAEAASVRSYLTPDGTVTSARHASPAAAFARRLGDMGGGMARSRSRRSKRTWRKLLWVKQSYPDNYTDQATFLENLQRNPRLRQYDFWPLVADSTIIVQHVCSVIIFVVCFVGIFQERVSPISVVSWGSGATSLGWLLWERWVAEDEAKEDELFAQVAVAVASSPSTPVNLGTASSNAAAGAAWSGSSRKASSMRKRKPTLRGEAAIAAAAAAAMAAAAAETNATVTASAETANGGPEPGALSSPDLLPQSASRTTSQPDGQPSELFPEMEMRTGRTYERLGTVKSAILIYFTLLGLSPILKSLTRSTSSDSIWAISFWLLLINVFSFDYSGGVAAKFPASLSTNAAVMASTVLASRLPTTIQVFSLTLFSIEVFGLFPVLRRYVRDRSWRYHVLLTSALVLGAGAGVGMILAGDGDQGATPSASLWPSPRSWRGGIVGMLVGAVIAMLTMGGCSWWLIGLQKYKNEIRGPWDPARPIIINRRR